MMPNEGGKIGQLARVQVLNLTSDVSKLFRFIIPLSFALPDFCRCRYLTSQYLAIKHFNSVSSGLSDYSRFLQ